MAQSNEQSRDSVDGEKTFVTPEQEFASIAEAPVLPVDEPATEPPFGERVSLSYDWLSLMPEPVIDLPSLQETPDGPYLDVNYDQDKVWGYKWPAEVLVELKINGTTFGTETSGSDGGVYFEIFDIGPGDVLTLQDSMTTREYTILPLAYEGNDQVNDWIFGTTAANTPWMFLPVTWITVPPSVQPLLKMVISPEISVAWWILPQVLTARYGQWMQMGMRRLFRGIS